MRQLQAGRADCPTLPAVSVIVPNHNGKQFLHDCFSSLASTNYPKSKMETIMVDNGSSDGSVEYVEQNFPWVRVISFKENLGFGRGSNEGASAARNEYLAFLNNDTVVERNWLIELIEQLSKDCRIVSSKTVFLRHPDIVEYSGGWLLPNGRGISTRFRRKDNFEAETYETGYPCAAAMVIEKKLFRTLCGFDGDYVASLDDTDLGWRAWLTGHRVLFCALSKVCHLSGGTIGKKRNLPIRIYHGTKNAYCNVIKNMEFSNMVVGLGLALGYDLMEVLGILRAGDALSLKAKARAYIWLAKNRRSLFGKRAFVQKARLNSDETLVRKGLLLGKTDSLRQFLVIRSFERKTW